LKNWSGTSKKSTRRNNRRCSSPATQSFDAALDWPAAESNSSSNHHATDNRAICRPLR
jgi:hypothetical protein